MSNKKKHRNKLRREEKHKSEGLLFASNAQADYFNSKILFDECHMPAHYGYQLVALQLLAQLKSRVTLTEAAYKSKVISPERNSNQELKDFTYYLKGSQNDTL